MPTVFLTNAERSNYQLLPKLSDAGFIQCYNLTDADKRFVASFHGSVNRLAIAIQICLVRHFGTLSDNWIDGVGTDAQTHLASQLKLVHRPVFPLNGYGSRDMTRLAHVQRILGHLSYRKWQPMDLAFNEEWLVQQGMEHDNERLLLEKLCQKLHREKILRPAIGTLERLVGGIAERLLKETYSRLSILWNDGMFKKLDTLLDLDGPLGFTPHRWLCSPPVANTQREMNHVMGKIDYLKAMGVDKWDMSPIPVNRRKLLANTVRNNGNVYLQRTLPIRRYPLLVSFLWETLLDTTDNLLIMYDCYWQHALSCSRRERDERLLGAAKQQPQALQTLINAAGMILDEAIEPAQLRQAIFKTQPREQIEGALAIVAMARDTNLQGHLWFLLGWHARFRAFATRLLSVISFRFAFQKDNLDEAIEWVVKLQNGTVKKLPPTVPSNFIKQSWQKIMFVNGAFQPKTYELCVLSVLRDRIMSGDVYVGLSRKFADFNSFLIPREKWLLEAGDICTRIDGLDIAARIGERTKELTALLDPLTKMLAKNTSGVRLEDGILVVPQVDGEGLTETARQLQDEINTRLPKIGLVDIVREVDRWMGWSNEVVGSEQKLPLCYAALLGNGCNLSLADIARSSELDYRALWWAANNDLSDENLKRANDMVINFHHKQWLSAHWGSGTLSSSDGQRFPTSGKIRNAQALPKYFGYGKGVTFYTHTSDQYSQYGTKVISATERDATYVLDEILSNETDLCILEHTTDTHGYSDLLFALFDLADKKFAPRIRDIKDQRLCRIKPSNESDQYPELKFTGTVNVDYLKKYADELRRVGASLQTGTVTASMLVGKLQAYPRQNNLMYVLLAWGQLNKTIFICRYLLDLQLRHKINAQLNKGEQLHNLRLYLWFGGDGFIRKKQEAQQQVTARSLNLLVNIVLAWNTVYIGEIIKQLRSEGRTVGDDDIKRISPAPFEHINRLGKYDFIGEMKLEINGLRALRKPKNKS